MNLAYSVRDRLAAWISAGEQSHFRIAARHHAFAIPRLLWAAAALSTLPLYLFIAGAPTTLDVALICWFIAPIFAVYILALTGDAEQAGLASVLSLLALSIAVASLGAPSSYALVWLLLAAIEGARVTPRFVHFSVCACAVTGGVILAAGLLRETHGGGESVTGMIASLSYALMLGVAELWASREYSDRQQKDESRYWLLAHHMTDAVGRVGRSGTVSFISPAAEKMLGVRTADLTGHGLFDRIHVADRPAYLKALADVAGSQEPSSIELRIKRDIAQPGKRTTVDFLWIEMRCNALKTEGAARDAQDVIITLRNISERKSQEQTVERAKAEAERANAAKTRFLATMSHELRTPLNAVIGFAEILCHEDQMGIDAARRIEYARLIHDSGEHLLSVVNLVLDMSKIESGNFEIMPEAVQAAPLLRTCCDLLALKAAEAGLDLAMQIPDDLPEIVADKRALKQILLNIIANSVKFTPPGGRIVVASRATATGILITVEDTGIGISADDLRRVGDPFFQVRSSYDRPYDGTGLGLSIVQGLLSLHGGSLKISSVLSEGTKVTISLPLNCEKQAAHAHREIGSPNLKRLEPIKSDTRDSAPREQVRKSA